jgi:hypothetical protein
MIHMREREREREITFNHVGIWAFWVGPNWLPYGQPIKTKS